MKPRLLIVLNYFYPYVSGISEYARFVAGLLKDDFEITILTGRHAAGLCEEEVLDGLHIIRAATLLGPRSTNSASKHLEKGYISSDLILRFSRLAAQSDVIYLHLPMLEAALLTYIGHKYAPILITYHCDVVPEGGLIDWLGVKSVLFSARVAAKKADAIVVLSKDYARGSRVLARLDEKVIEIPPFSKLESRPLDTQLPIRETYNVGFVGRFAQEKGIDVVLDAICPVVERIPNVRFFFVGETRDVAGGSEYGTAATILARHSPYVKLLGRLSDDELWKMYNTLDVLLLPSINAYEAFGLVQIEAMLAGALVIASDMRGVRVPVSVTGNGRLVVPGSVQSLVDAVIDCHSLRPEYARDRVRERALQYFSASVARESYVSTILSLLGKR